MVYYDLSLLKWIYVSFPLSKWNFHLFSPSTFSFLFILLKQRARARRLDSPCWEGVAHITTTGAESKQIRHLLCYYNWHFFGADFYTSYRLNKLAYVFHSILSISRKLSEIDQFNTYPTPESIYTYLGGFACIDTTSKIVLYIGSCCAKYSLFYFLNMKIFWWPKFTQKLNDSDQYIWTGTVCIYVYFSEHIARPMGYGRVRRQCYFYSQFMVIFISQIVWRSESFKQKPTLVWNTVSLSCPQPQQHNLCPYVYVYTMY